MDQTPQLESGWVMEERENLPAPREVAYSITSKYFPELRIVKSTNAWWMDRRKVEDLIDALKNGHTVESSCVWAGISRGQWNYFREVHPEFSDITAALEHVQYFIAMQGVNSALDKDPKLALSFLKATHPRFKPAPKVEAPAVVQQSVQVAVTTNVDTTAIEANIAAAADAIIASIRGGESLDHNVDRQGVEAEGASSGN